MLVQAGADILFVEAPESEVPWEPKMTWGSGFKAHTMYVCVGVCLFVCMYIHITM